MYWVELGIKRRCIHTCTDTLAMRVALPVDKPALLWSGSSIRLTVPLAAAVEARIPELAMLTAD